MEKIPESNGIIDDDTKMQSTIKNYNYILYR